MYTQCPHCLTLFRISSEELKAAAGQARCCQCDRVFNALETLQESPVMHNAPLQPAAGTPVSDHPPEEIHNEASPLTPLKPESEQPIEPGIDADVVPPEKPEAADEVFMIRNDGLETEPDYLAAGSESQMSELLDSESAPLINASEAPKLDATIVPLNQHTEADERLDTTAAEAPPITIEGPDPATEKHLFRFTERQKDERNPYAEDASAPRVPLDKVFEKQSTPISTFAWGAAGLLMILIIILQLGWQYREQVIQYEYGRLLLSEVCNIAGCITPERRDTSQIVIQHRDLRAHPSKSDALLLQLSLVNRADFAQPFPRLHLSLFNDRDKLIADRIFEPLEYLSDPQILNHLMPQAEPIFISMELLDPGKDVTGFKFDFL